MLLRRIAIDQKHQDRSSLTVKASRLSDLRSNFHTGQIFNIDLQHPHSNNKYLPIFKYVVKQEERRSTVELKTSDQIQIQKDFRNSSLQKSMGQKTQQKFNLKERKAEHEGSQTEKKQETDFNIYFCFYCNIYQMVIQCTKNPILWKGILVALLMASIQGLTSSPSAFVATNQYIKTGSKSISRSGLSAGTAVHTFSITLSVAFSSYKSMACFSELDYDIPASKIMNLTVIPINFSSTILKLELHSLTANQVYQGRLRYMIYDSALTQLQNTIMVFTSTAGGGTNLKANSDLVLTHTLTDITPSTDVGVFVVLSGFDLETTSSHDFNFDITDSLSGSTVQLTISATNTLNVKVKTMSFSVLVWNKNLIETAAIPTRIYYQKFASNSQTLTNYQNYNTYYGLSGARATRNNIQMEMEYEYGQLEGQIQYATYTRFSVLLFTFKTCSSTTPYYHGVDNLCYDICPPRFGGSGDSCLACPYDCFLCDSAGLCTSCNATTDFRQLSSGRCIPLPGYYDDGSSTVALPCDTSSCAECQNTSTTCTACHTGMTLSGTTCQCSPGYIHDGSNCVVDCSALNHCLNCTTSGSSQIDCTSCSTGYDPMNVTHANGSSQMLCISSCGSGIVESPKTCDDGNTVSGDGCSSTCDLQSGFSCPTPGAVCSPICGDSLIRGVEECDDGNVADGDGCSSTCTEESGYNCTGVPSVCSPVCGDSVILGPQTCDDGNMANGDGCSDSCQVQAGFNCSSGNCTAICGDSLVLGAQYCDDGNNSPGDGCSPTCLFQSGYTCTGQPSVCGPLCGDVIVLSPETCDDGNTINGDGCSSTCQTESGFTCPSAGSVGGNCSAICGDSLILGAQECDDGNNITSDGCSSTCTVQTGYNCTGVPSVCSPICGDSLILGSESCDDGNILDGDGCSSTCSVETGFDCSSGNCTAICGDSLVLGAEQCDDGNNVTGDGCSPTCTIESGYTCSGQPSVCGPLCGDTIVLSPQTCDDGNTVSGDGCSSNCTQQTGYICPSSNNTGGNCTAICGDSLVIGLEQCDDGNNATGDGCSPTCFIQAGFNCSGQPSVCAPICGDLIVLSPQACDDGNIIDGDGCSSTCLTQTGFICPSSNTTGGNCTTICGDALVLGTQECDDGNNITGDGCSPTCTTETGYNCSGQPSACTPICGDLIVYSPQTCDDGNIVDGDGCSSTCLVENGFSCPTSNSTGGNCSAICGDALVLGSQECDDGNNSTGDGCTSTCSIQTGYNCSGQPSICAPICGDTIVFSPQTCDDGNIVDGDGCSSSCLTESGFVCPNSNTTGGTCSAICGDSLVRGLEQCDDGNNSTGDGCSPTCTIQTGYNCSGQPSICAPICGDTIVFSPQTCDDGNIVDGDGCSSTCLTQTGFTCPSSNTTGGNCTAICGDALVLGAQECDDGNNITGDGCSSCIFQSGFSCTGQPSVCAPICGDSIVLTPESCDDGNTNDGDGCSSVCQIQTGFICSSSNSTGGNCTAICGDSLVLGSQECDDGNSSTAGCSSTCTIETGYSCSGQPSVCSPICGDTIVLAPENCDDGNTVSGDGCSSSCIQQTGYICPSSNTTGGNCTAICGDTLVLGAQECDDGNNITGDGCSPICTIQTGYNCSGQPSVCSPICGDTIVFSPQTCDDGNMLDGDGCSSSCLTESGFVCPNSNTTGGNCTAICGDSLILGLEQCDDGNNSTGDGCSDLCMEESGYSCTGQPSVCSSVCGDSIVINPPEFCDDGNTANGDGCSQSCQTETGFSCPSSGGICVPICGDSVILGSQTCDDGNNVTGDGCSASCLVENGYQCLVPGSPCSPVCGDGLLFSPQTCDDNNTVDGDGCSSSCLQQSGYACSGTPSVCQVVCGDGIILGSQTCDDGNSVAGDGCSSSCLVESGWICPTPGQSCQEICGDGLTIGNQTCDDSNTVDGDGCSSSCRIESGYFCPGGINCQHCLSHCLSCTSSSDCTQCDSISAWDGSACAPNCSVIEGCEDCNIPGVDLVCTQCQGEYNLIGGGCFAICGDGNIMPSEGCDDANTNDGDGCSSSCHVESNYVCNGTTPAGASECYLLQVELTRQATIKDVSSNSFTLFFQPQVVLSDLFSSIDWSQMITIAPDSPLQLARVSSAIFNPSTGQVEIAIDYSEDATNKDLKLDVDYTNMKSQASASNSSAAPSLSLLSASRVSVSLSQSDNNLSLDYYEDSTYSLANICLLVAQIMSAAAFLLALIALLGAKLVGLETLAVFQAAFLAMLSLDDMTPIMESLGGLQYSVGYNQLQKYNKQQNLDKEFIAVEFSQQFIKNYNITFILIAIPLVMALIFKIASKVCNSDKKKAERMENYFRLAIGEYSFYGFMASGYLIFLSTTLALITFSSNSDFIGVGVGAAFFIAAIVYQIALCAKPDFFGEFKEKFNKKRPNYHFYNFMIVERMVTGVAFGVITWLSFQCLVVSVVYATELIYIIIRRPYKERNWRPVLNMAITILILVIYYLMNTMTGAIKQYAPLGVLILLAVCFVYSTIILVVQLKQTLTKLCGEEDAGQQFDDLQKQNVDNLSILKSNRNPLIETTALGQLMLDESPCVLMNGDSPETPNKNQLNAIKLSLAEVKMSGNNNIKPLDMLNLNGTFDFDDALDDFESEPGDNPQILNRLNKEPQETHQIELEEQNKQKQKQQAEKKVVLDESRGNMDPVDESVLDENINI